MLAALPLDPVHPREPDDGFVDEIARANRAITFACQAPLGDLAKARLQFFEKMLARDWELGG